MVEDDARALRVLRNAPPFSLLPETDFRLLVPSFQLARYNAGETVIEEGAIGDSLYVVSGGRAEVLTQGANGPVVLATLSEGEVFGELALLGAGNRRQATVRAASPLSLFVLPAADFRSFLSAHPAVEADFLENAGFLRVVKLLKQASPFSALDARKIKDMAGTLRGLSVESGAAIVRQGEPGDACYLLREGSAEVVRETERGERRLATLRAGDLFGEAALLTEAPRSATVRALERCELLSLDRARLLSVMGRDPDVTLQMMELLHLRDCPRQTPGVLAHERRTPEGDAITILQDTRRGAYFRLSGQGRFLWDRLDGRHTIRDLALDYLSEFKSFAPERVAETVRGLAVAGFVEGRRLKDDVAPLAEERGPWRRLWGQTHRVLQWKAAFRGIDGRITRLYETRARWVYTAGGQALIAAVAATGLGAFLAAGRGAAAGAWSLKGDWRVWLFLIPSYCAALLIHESGHALTAKAFGYQVPRAGVGWHYFMPIAFVDTSALWLAPKWPRIATSLAGPYSELVLAGAAAMLASAAPGKVSAVLWIFALGLYVSAFFNLSPLFESDGYYILTDALDAPNLRQSSLRWMFREFPKAALEPRRLAGHGAELGYGLASLACVAALSWAVAAFSRRFFPGALWNWVFAAGTAIASLGAMFDPGFGRRHWR